MLMELGVVALEVQDKKPYNIDETNNIYDKLTVLEYAGKNSRGLNLWKCKCECGNIINVLGSSLRNHHTKSCGKCTHSKNRQFTPLKGNKFRLLEVIEDFKHTDNNNITRHAIKCLCHGCNKEVVFFNATFSRMKNKYSCGCKTRRGQSNKTHGESKTAFYNLYRGIRNRCEIPSDKNYMKYGGRGIKCLWNTYEEFKEDMYDSYLEHIEKYGKKNTSIDRIDVNGDYCKENCRWATNEEQANNTRVNQYYTYNGETHTIREWEKLYGIHRGTLWNRLKVLKMDIGTALNYKRTGGVGSTGRK